MMKYPFSCHFRALCTFLSELPALSSEFGDGEEDIVELYVDEGGLRTIEGLGPGEPARIDDKW